MFLVTFTFGQAFAGANLIQNGTLQLSSPSKMPYEWKLGEWAGMTGTHEIIPGKSGKAIQITVSGSDETVADRGVAFQQLHPTTVHQGEVYHYRDYIKGTVAKVYLDVEFLRFDGSKFYRGITYSKPYGEWMRVDDTFTVPPGAVAMTVLRVVKDNGVIAFDNISLWQDAIKCEKGCVSFAFDDSRGQQLVPRILHDTGIYATFYVNPVPITEKWEPIVMPLSTLRYLARYGHEIANHSATHLHPKLLPPDVLHNEVVWSKHRIENLVNRSVLSFAYPYGESDATVIAKVKRFHSSARGVEVGQNAINTDDYNLKTLVVTESMSVAEVKAYIDEASNTGKWLILSFHTISRAKTGAVWNYRAADLRALILYAKEKQTHIITVSDGVARFLK